MSHCLSSSSAAAVTPFTGVFTQQTTLRTNAAAAAAIATTVHGSCAFLYFARAFY
jgi:hypothetical protein